MNRILVTSVIALGLALGGSFANLADAASQCVGLSSSACSTKSSQCTWRKASVNKNGNKIKAHCRALPGKAKASSGSKAKATKAKATSNNSKTEKKTSSAKSSTSSKKTSSLKDAKKKDAKKKDAKKKIKKKAKKKTG